ncbi:hypothetical protein PICSAR206_03933 [Mycobacterium avium subsp. paratuberculosis]|nr:hypothetical protein PICSAR154_02988 [Mycobacterium avium subsp. paratuberculosis]CAG7112963.1 hypothetical protein PICSAR206_03933 [Mycobacterium avium subsp. paratuberculosis]
MVAVIESTHREESMLVARRFAAVAALLRHRVATTDRPEPEYAEIDGFEQTAAEVAAAMNLSAAAASYLVSYAETLDTRLPEVAALLAEGPNRLAHSTIDHHPHESGHRHGIDRQA